MAALLGIGLCISVMLKLGHITPAQAAVAHYHMVWTLFAQRHAREFTYARDAR